METLTGSLQGKVLILKKGDPFSDHPLVFRGCLELLDQVAAMRTESRLRPIC